MAISDDIIYLMLFYCLHFNEACNSNVPNNLHKLNVSLSLETTLEGAVELFLF